MSVELSHSFAARCYAECGYATVSLSVCLPVLSVSQ